MHIFTVVLAKYNTVNFRITNNLNFSTMPNSQYEYRGICINGFLMLFIHIATAALAVWLFMSGTPYQNIIGVIISILWVIAVKGYIMLEPNESMVLVFFGKYSGTFYKVGYHWINPFLTTKKISLRIRNLDVDPIKVNDKVGNPILIGLVLVWKIKDTYRAVFDLDSRGTNINASTQTFVAIQSDAALREVAGKYAYDDEHGLEHELTLRGGGEEINDQLERKLNERLAMAGIEVVEARINYLAYAPEIAAVMLRRQQASAIISAREKIVEGAVSMVKLALNRLEEDNVVQLDNDRKAAMIGNLLVVLCADDAAQPVVNASN